MPGSAQQDCQAVADCAVILPHPNLRRDVLPDARLQLHDYPANYLQCVGGKPPHHPPKSLSERVTFLAAKTLVHVVKLSTPLFLGRGRQWERRFLVLSSLAPVPGLVAAVVRHLKSVVTHEEDSGRLHTFLAEAENEHAHLLAWLDIRCPGLVVRSSIAVAEVLFFQLYVVLYLLAPSACHSLVRYMEEEAISLYSTALRDMDEGNLWAAPAPQRARSYWNLPADATLREVLLAMRADAACSSTLNGAFAAMHHVIANPAWSSHSTSSKAAVHTVRQLAVGVPEAAPASKPAQQPPGDLLRTMEQLWGEELG
ncbi:hypothetical protein WJX72_000781 [[Myrmecia] bisecta]|uniref:Ubiquinol oxidase n=1 Tax=[Myrmecia] bisecta TaxID=41462 RepID=A0AAW1PVI8_9CHLO